MLVYLIYNTEEQYTISHSVYLMHNQFHLLSEKMLKIFNLQFRDLTQEYKKENNNELSFKKFITRNATEPGKIIFFGRIFLTKSYIFNRDFILGLKKKHNIHLWLDDLQKFYFNDILKIGRHSTELLKNKDIHLIDKIITPSIVFFKNINSPFINKTIYQFYSIDSYLFKKVKPFDERSDKIFLSGYIDSSYKSRSRLLKLYKTKKRYNSSIHYHPHPGYGKGNIDPNYLETLQDFKYAFIGLGNYPMNFCISKIIETIAAGTLAIIEDSSLLKTEMGLIPYHHYIPMTDFNNIINFEELEYLQTHNLDKKIAKKGRKHVLVNYDFRMKIFELLKKI